MKILVTDTACFVGLHLVKKLLERGDEVVGFDNTNDYYNVNLKYTRLNELGISQNEITSNKLIKIDKYANHKFIKIIIANINDINALFKKEKFDAACNLAAQVRIRYSLENPHSIKCSRIYEYFISEYMKEAIKNFIPMQDGDVVSTYTDVSDLINDFDYKLDTKLSGGIEEFYGKKNK